MYTDVVNIKVKMKVSKSVRQLNRFRNDSLMPARDVIMDKRRKRMTPQMLSIQRI